jgi:hypothetical protein
MDTWVWILIAVAAIVVIGLAAAALSRKRRSDHLQERFGPEYERTVGEAESRRDAERELADREKRHDELDIVPLSDGARTRYAGRWQDVQARFVDDPEGAVHEADALVQQVMAERGYPVDDDFERRAADVSVDHPDVVENFREAHGLLTRYDHGEGGTEALRRAMVHYRSLFDELLEGGRVGEEVSS